MSDFRCQGPSELIPDTGDFQQALRQWFQEHQRDLPWRRERSVYRTVVSEFMLQQTRVETVLPYFERWMREFPDFQALATASEEAVVKCWEGLGYYSRARNLHSLAKQIASLENLPHAPEGWRQLPGVGPYTAAAITSLSFRAPAACVDGNVVRILARLTADQTPYSNSSDAVKKFTPLASALLDPTEPGKHNEAMMELGATVCMRRKPNCLICPLRRFCRARTLGEPESFPRLEPKQIQKQRVNRIWCRDNKERLLLHRIETKARRLAGMWELPTIEQAHLSPKETVRKGNLLFQAKRAITRYSITESIYEVTLDQTTMQSLEASTGLVWKSPEEIRSLTFSGPHRRWVDKLLQTVI